VSPIKTPLRVAAVLPLSGAESLFGTQGLQGARMAVAEINAAGGVLGRQVELQVHDQATDTERAVRMTREALADPTVLAVLGPTSSADRDAMLPLCEAARRPLLYATDYEGGQCSRYLFAYSPIPDHYVGPLVPYLTRRAGDTFSIIGADYVWPRGIARALRAAVATAGGRIRSEQYRPIDAMDFTSDIAAIAQSGARHVVMMLLGASGQEFIRQFAAHDFDERPVLSVMAFNENYMAGLSDEQVEGIVTVAPFLASLDRPETRSFVARQRAMFGPQTVVSYFAESHYGLLMFWRDAVAAAGSADVEAVVDALGSGRTRVVGNGPVTLRSSDHHMILNMVIAEARSGQLVAVDYVGPVAPADQCNGRGATTGD
jgi:ABC-type branched-subunit amino acid transport system substrate-binding protein